MSGSIHSGVDAVLFAFCEHFCQKIDLQHAFSTGEGDTAAGIFVKGAVPQNLFQNFICGSGSAFQHSGTSWAVDRAASAQGAGFVFADLSAFAAAGTFVSVNQQLGRGDLAFGVMAPDAAQITSLKEDRGAYARIFAG